MPVVQRGRQAGPAAAGARDRYVLIEWRPAADAVETSGLPKDEWTPYRFVFMRRETTALEERFASDQITAAFQTRWISEYLVDLDPDVVDVPKRVRLVYGGRVFDVVGAAVIGRGQAMELVTIAGSSLEA